MWTFRALSFLAVFGGAGAAPCTPANSCPKLSDGLYCPVNDVTEHADINKDVAQIARHLREDPINYAQAKEVYTNGQYSSKGGGRMRTLQGMALKDMTSGGTYTNTFYQGARSLYGTTEAIWDNWMVACLDATGPCAGKSDDFRKYVINKGCIGIVTAYATYEMGAAVWKAANGQTTDTGAAYAWDEAAAFHIGNIEPNGNGYTGSAPGNLYSPYEFNWKRDKDFPDGLSTHTETVPILNHGLKSLRGSDYDASSVDAAQLAMYKVYAIAAIRSAIKYSSKAQNTDGAFSDKYLAEGSIYWRTASGYLSTINMTVVQEVDALLDLQKTSLDANVPCQVKTLVETLYDGLGITCQMVGTWKDAPSGSCLATACGSTGETLLDGDTAYVDMCRVVQTPSGDERTSGATAGPGLVSACVAVVLATLA